MRRRQHSPSRAPSRRDFLAWSGSCCAHLMWMSEGAAVGTRRAFAAASQGTVLAEEPWGRVEALHDGVWAIVSTPLAHNDRTTLSNGGIVAGTERVLVIESFASPAGAAWAARQARTLTGRWPTDVVITHYHGDHTNGVTGYLENGEAPRIWMTGQTRQLLTRTPARNDGRGDEGSRASLFDTASEIAAGQSTEIDLGGRTAHLEPHAGHTASDVTIAIDDPSVVFYGDLLWNGMFPNFRDTTPSLFASSIRAARRARETVYVPGHGQLAGRADIAHLLAMLEEVEQAARESFRTEVSATEMGRVFRLPESLGQWAMLGDNYLDVAFSAWHRELSAAQ